MTYADKIINIKQIMRICCDRDFCVTIDNPCLKLRLKNGCSRGCRNVALNSVKKILELSTEDSKN